MIFIRVLDTAKRHPMLFMGIAFALYSMVVSSAVQMVILPHIFPSIHAGNGLLAGGDFPGLHGIAVRMASRIANEGWSVWELSPENQSPAGLASAIYALTYPKPWVLIPINAALHALGGVIIARLIQILTDDALIAVWGGALYVAFPSSLLWVSQIQKDSTYFLGMLATLLGVVTLIRSTSINAKLSNRSFAIALIALGLLLTGAVRFYGIELISGVTAIIAIFLIPILIKRSWCGRVSKKTLAFTICTLAIIIVVAKYAPRDTRFDGEWPTARPTSNKGSNTYLSPFDQTFPDNAITIAEHWQPTEYLPIWLDKTIMRLGVARGGWAGPSYANAGSMIDMNVQFLNTWQVLSYLPRALQIAFLAPFPKDWLAQGSSPGGSIMRRVTGIEMLVLYPLLLLGLPLAAWRWKERLEFWAIIVFCVTILTTYAYVIPNLGTLYRMRYGFLMPLAAVGLSAILLTLKQLKNENPNTTVL